MFSVNRFYLVGIITALFLSSSLAQAQVVKENREVGTFKSVDVGGAFNVLIKQGNRHSVVVEADKDIIDKIATEVRGTRLRITQSGKINNPGVLKITIEMTDVEGIEASGASQIQSRDIIKGGNLDLVVSGASTVDLMFEGQSIDVEVKGASNLTLEGKVKDQIARVSGAGNYHAYDLQSEVLEIESTGAGNAQVHASQKIKARASGAGNISYRGDPERVYADATGAGNIDRR